MRLLFFIIFGICNATHSKERFLPDDCLSAAGRHSVSSYSTAFSQAQVPSLFHLHQLRSSREIYRLTVLPSFGAAHVLSIEVDSKSSKGQFVEYEQTVGRDNEVHLPIELHKDYVGQMRAIFHAKEFLGLKATEDCVGCRDGSLWLIETLFANTYKCIERRSPDPAAFKDAALLLLRLAGKESLIND